MGGVTLSTRKVHPALDIADEQVVLGRVSPGGDYDLITSDRRIIPATELKDQLLFLPRPYADLAGRWPDEDLAGFLAGEDPPKFSEILALIISVLDAAMEFPRPEQRSLIAVWGLATYFFPLFLTFPRLSFSGERESGKSKALTLLRATAWNALYLLSPTPAVLFRLIHEFRATMLLDEVEGLNSEDAREVLAVINSGYKFGGSVPRCEGERLRRVELFQVYAPMALAAIRSLNSVTEDRAVPIVLQRGTDPQRMNTEVDLAAPVFAQIRSGCHRLLLSGWRDVRSYQQTITLPPWLNARARELWKPLLAVAGIADRENGLQLTPDLLALAREHVRDRAGVSVEAEALLAVLIERLVGAQSVTIRPRDLRDPLREQMGWREGPSAEAVGTWLRRLGFRRTRKDREGALYEVTTAHVVDLAARYGVQEVAEP